MAKAQNIANLTDFRQPIDPAHAAFLRAQSAGDDDAAYAAAMALVETEPATTLRGVLAKFDAFCSYVDATIDVDLLSDEGSRAIELLRKDIRSALVARSAN